MNLNGAGILSICDATGDLQYLLRDHTAPARTRLLKVAILIVYYLASSFNWPLLPQHWPDATILIQSDEQLEKGVLVSDLQRYISV